MKNQYIVFDCESGGTAPDKSILTVYFEVLDENLNFVDSLDLKVKPNDGVYRVTAEAISVNKIDLIEHDKVAVTYSKAGQTLREFLMKHYLLGKKSPLIPIGKNVQFDIGFVNAHLLQAKTWNQFVSYRIMEVTTMALVAQYKGQIPQGSISLEALVKHFKIQIPGEAHNAEYDTKATAEVFRKLMAL